MTTTLQSLRVVNIVLCLVGVLVFGTLLSYVLNNASDVEKRAQAFLVAEVDEHVAEQLARWQKMAAIAEHFVPANELDSRPVAQRTRAAVSDFIRAMVAATCDINCEQSAAAEELARQIYDRELANLRIGLEMLQDWVRGHYQKRLDGLLRDLSIFLFCNLLATGLALSLAILRVQAARHLLPISAVLFASTVLATVWYLFGQSWINTIVHARYFGWGYLGLIAIVFLLLADIAFNRGRVIAGIARESFNGPLGF